MLNYLRVKDNGVWSLFLKDSAETKYSLNDIRFGNDFFENDIKSLGNNNKKIDKLDYIKMKPYYTSKNITKRLKKQHME